MKLTSPTTTNISFCVNSCKFWFRFDKFAQFNLHISGSRRKICVCIGLVMSDRYDEIQTAFLPHPEKQRYLDLFRCNKFGGMSGMVFDTVACALLSPESGAYLAGIPGCNLLVTLWHPPRRAKSIFSWVRFQTIWLKQHQVPNRFFAHSPKPNSTSSNELCICSIVY